MRKSRRPTPLRGTIRVPGDKSISHRALILSALAEGRSIISNINTGDDVLATGQALAALGVTCALEHTTATVDGLGATGLREPDSVLDLRNSGTSLRTLSGICAGIAGLSVLTGDGSLRRRPMLRVVVPLRQMGATIDGRAHGENAPLAIRGGGLQGIDVELDVASAQVKTALLIAGLQAAGVTRVAEPGASRDHTERMLRAAGARIVSDGTVTEVSGGGSLTPMSLQVPGDISSALFFIVAAALIEGSELVIQDVGLNPTRTGALDALIRMGADITIAVEEERVGEPVGTVTVKASELRGIEIGPDEIPGLIDEIPALAVCATQASGTTTITGARELRVKESDRISAIATGLNALGARVEEREDGLVISGPSTLYGGDVDSLGDHRIAMMLAIAGVIGAANVKVNGWSSVATSFPEFLDILGAAQGRIAARKEAAAR
ncbi:MAG TPA: 3-phosphoshikimate 1-carboxyvinyltransferase [Actinomycetota bacterium]|nr:3-phosphoshikimate 1-carboxyvinyltransferase [Actinomycetota bacterium]